VAAAAAVPVVKPSLSFPFRLRLVRVRLAGIAVHALSISSAVRRPLLLTSFAA